jgi:crossover junction endodeoxyribonuclease RuvC
MKFLGIDPGLSGGIALVGSIGSNPRAQAWKMPETERDVSDLFLSLKSQVSKAYIERVHSMPGQGVSSSFKFGVSYGFLRGMLIAHGIPFEEVTPQKWQKLLGCLTKGDKNISKAKAQQIFPNIKVTHKIADALLIGEYARLITNDDNDPWEEL